MVVGRSRKRAQRVDGEGVLVAQEERPREDVGEAEREVVRRAGVGDEGEARGEPRVVGGNGREARACAGVHTHAGRRVGLGKREVEREQLRRRPGGVRHPDVLDRRGVEIHQRRDAHHAVARAARRECAAVRQRRDGRRGRAVVVGRKSRRRRRVQLETDVVLVGRTRSARSRRGPRGEEVVRRTAAERDLVQEVDACHAAVRLQTAASAGKDAQRGGQRRGVTRARRERQHLIGAWRVGVPHTLLQIRLANGRHCFIRRGATTGLAWNGSDEMRSAEAHVSFVGGGGYTALVSEKEYVISPGRKNGVL